VHAVADQLIAAPLGPSDRQARDRPARRSLRPRAPWWGWVAGTAIILLLAVAFVVATGMRPAYDAYGWLVWGRQAVHLRLDTDSAPSWKPLTFLFTFPYALLVGRSALWLWMVTAVAAGFAAPVFGARTAYRLTIDGGARRYAALLAGAFAGAAVLGIAGYWHFMLIATADPMMVALTLAAIDCAVWGRPRWAWALTVLVCLGRPEAWPIALVYAAWAWRARPAMRAGLVVGLALIPLLWFGIPALTSQSWLIAGDVLGESTAPLTGNKLLAVMRGFVSLYELPMQIAALAALVLALVLRRWRWLLLGATAAVWLACEVALAWHGWGVAPRYMFEPAAVLIVVAAAGVGQALALDRRRLGLLRWPAVAAVLALAVTLAPHARIRARLVHNGIVLGRTWARQIRRLHDVIAREGGPKRILACGAAVTTVPYQSIVAWELDQNVFEVGWNPSTWIALGPPLVYFQPVAAGWQIIPVHSFFSRDPAGCQRLQTSTPVN
jgi:hypothetical protein